MGGETGTREEQEKAHRPYKHPNDDDDDADEDKNIHVL